MTALHLVMPMAGRGSRFARQGFDCPKPLVPLHGKPFFAWAVDSIACKVDVGDIVFVVLREHVSGFAIDREIAARFPAARIVVIDDVTAGAAATAAIGIQALPRPGAFAVNDCDHAFDATGIDALLPALQAGTSAAALVGFRSASPAFSYVRFDAGGRVTATVEKEVVGPFAIAGCYFFGSRSAFEDNYTRYRQTCRYDELFISGVYNTLLDGGAAVGFHALRRHIAFGTPQEMAQVDAASLAAVTERATAPR